MTPLGNNVTEELISATSALNTEVTCATYILGRIPYISEVEPMVKHSQEHINSALFVISSLIEELDELKGYIHSIPFDKFDMVTEEKLINKMIDKIQQRL